MRMIFTAKIWRRRRSRAFLQKARKAKTRIHFPAHGRWCARSIPPCITSGSAGWFAEEIPGVTVETVTYPENGYREKVQLALVGGEEIDLLDTQLLSVRDLANSGLVRDLGVFYDNNAQEDYVNMVDTYRVDGKLYEMPVTVLPMAVWTDKKMTESLGVELPETLSFSTLNDWTQQAEKGSEYYMIKEYPKASAVHERAFRVLGF